MDIACSSRNVAMLRRLERCAPFSGWVMMKVPQFGGLGASWQRRWAVVSHRYPNPRVRAGATGAGGWWVSGAQHCAPQLVQAPASRQLTHCVFLAYKNLAAAAPSCRVWLDGARAVSTRCHCVLDVVGNGHCPAWPAWCAVPSWGMAMGLSCMWSVNSQPHSAISFEQHCRVIR